jgi:anti-sigma-K factor RskA
MSELNDMSCAKFADVAAELALGVLTGRERAEALAHLDHCEACREHVRQLTMTGEQLITLLPSREPPAGFETRVMERIGLTAPGRARAAPGRIGPISRFSRAISRLGHRVSRAGRPVGRPRRLLAAAAVAVAVIGAGLGGWGLRAGTSPAAARPPLTLAALLSASRHTVGEVYYYDGHSRWIFMSVNMNTGLPSGTVTCQLVQPRLGKPRRPGRRAADRRERHRPGHRHPACGVSLMPAVPASRHLPFSVIRLSHLRPNCAGSTVA